MKLKVKIRKKLKAYMGESDIYLAVKPLRYPFYRAFYPVLEINELRLLNSISHTHKFAYFHVPKAANTAIKYNLYLRCGNAPAQSTAEREAVLFSIDKYFDKAFNLKAAQLDEFKHSYFKFSFVRHPLTRITATYLEKIHLNKVTKKKVSDFLGRKRSEVITWDEFLCFLEQGGLRLDTHWALQSEILTMPLSQFNFIGKIENFESDFNHVQQSIFGSVVLIEEWRFHSSGGLKDMLDVTDADKKRIYKIYESDFDNFKYVL